MKFMNMKRFGATVMAGAMALSLAAPAFAANTTVIEGSYVDIPIAVLVPETGTAQINPYGLPVAVYKSDDSAVNIVGEKITNVPLSIRNQGDVALDVNATLAVLPRGGLSIKGAALANTDKGKEVNVTLEIAGLDDSAYALGFEADGLEDALIDAFADDDTWSGLTAANKLGAPAAAENATTVTPAKSNAAMATLGATTGTGDDIKYGDDSIALFRLAGELNAEPEKTVDSNQVEDPWTEEDGFTATVVFKFTPNTTVTPTTYTITEGSHTDVGSDITSVTVNGTAAAGDTVTVTVAATTGKTITGTIDGGTTSFNLTESSGTYTGTFTMPSNNVTLTLTVA